MLDCHFSNVAKLVRKCQLTSRGYVRNGVCSVILPDTTCAHPALTAHPCVPPLWILVQLYWGGAV